MRLVASRHEVHTDVADDRCAARRARPPHGTGNALYPAHPNVVAGSTVAQHYQPAVHPDRCHGNSTLIKLLTGMYAPAQGRILVDDTPLDDIDLTAWRARCSGAFQDHANFELTAGETVGIGDHQHIGDQDEIHRALRAAAGEDVVHALPQGLQTQLGTTWPGGVDISGGQWQRLAIARGMMRHEPLFLALDEPTSALDATTEHVLFLAYFYSASQPQQLVVAAGIEQENDDIVKQYHAHRDLAELLQYDLDERGATTIYGKPRVRAVQSRADPAVRATVTTNVTDLAKTQAPPAEYQWRVASGATHGGMWATEGELIRVEAGVSRGAPLVAAATTALQGTETLLEAMAAYVCVESGRAPWLTRFAEINRGLYEKVRDLGFFAKSPG